MVATSPPSIENLIEVELANEDAYRKIRETLTRIGFTKDKVLYQSCFIALIDEKYYIAHFKELYALEGKSTSEYTNFDEAIRNSVAKMLENWKLLRIKNPEIINPSLQNRIPVVITFKDKRNWKLVPQYIETIRKSVNNAQVCNTTVPKL